MIENKNEVLSFDEFDEITNPGPEITGFEQVIERAMSRRSFLGSGLAIGASAFVLGSTALTPFNAKAASSFDFEPIPANSLDTVTVPKGYSWQVVTQWSD